MATKQQQAKGAGANGEGAKPAGPPAGYRRRSSVSDASWVAQQQGNICNGKILGRHAMQQTPVRYYYQIELLKPCKVRVGRGEDAEIEEVPAGEVVNLNETYQIAVLKEIEIPEILAGAEYNVWAEFKNKIKVANGTRTMWNVDVSSVQVKPPTREVRPLPKDDDAEGEEGAAAAPF